VEFDLRYGFSIDTVGPLQFEYVVALIVATGVARLAALAVWAGMSRIDDTTARFAYGGALALVLGISVLALPSLLLAWLYSLTHPGAFVCTFLVWPGLLLPLGVYVWSLMKLLRRERHEEAIAR
jgi:hypothetical protein